MDLQKQFEKETKTGEFSKKNDPVTYYKLYSRWLKQRLQAGHHETFVMWRSVEDELPEMGRKKYCSNPVLVFVECNNGLKLVEIAEMDFHGYWYDYGKEFGKIVTHWAPLPKPPQDT